jgi:hypothetical protein
MPWCQREYLRSARRDKTQPDKGEESGFGHRTDTPNIVSISRPE